MPNRPTTSARLSGDGAAGPSAGSQWPKKRQAEVCQICFAFATEDAAELNNHSEACFARAAEREAGAAPAAEARYRRYLAYRSLPLTQCCAVLLTLNSLGTAFRMALALISPRWARSSSTLSSVPVLYEPWGRAPPTSAWRVPEETALGICRVLFPVFAFVRFPVMLALFVVCTSPARREWFLARCSPVYLTALLVETLTATVILEATVWFTLRRVVVWPPAMVICSTLGDVIAHYMPPFTLPEYYAVIGARALLLNTALLTVPFQPGNAREMWPTALQAAVHLLLLAHAPRQSRLMRARWQAQTAAAARLHGD